MSNKNKLTKKSPYILMILDGIGHRVDTKDNAVAAAKTPTLDRLLASCPNGLISGSGLDVGLPEGQFGNSEVGHMNLGAGRILFQDSTKISQAIDNKEFFDNEALTQAIDQAVANDAAVQVLGLLSDGGVHSHQTHLFAVCRLALMRGASRVYVHAFLDGRDTPPKSAQQYVSALQTAIDELNGEYLGQVVLASVVGRFFAMDRDNRWDRVQKTYELLTQAKANYRADTGQQAVDLAYHRGETDEFIEPTIIDDNGVIGDKDSVIFVNFRADRARQLSTALLDDEFTGFNRPTKPSLSAFVSLTKYSDDLANHPKVAIAYPATKLDNTLGEYLAKLGKTQLRIAETEKYAHVTFFFSGGREALYDGEERILVASPDVTTYDKKPEMSAFEVTDKLIQALQTGGFDVAIVNYANGDMVGHTGDFDAAVKAVETVDSCIAKVVDAIKPLGGQMLITADHGNCEQMFDYNSKQLHTQHTTELVPFIYVGDKNVDVRDGGRLCDVAPTLLWLMGIKKPDEMTGETLLQN